jgi:hypothetical protein
LKGLAVIFGVAFASLMIFVGKAMAAYPPSKPPPSGPPSGPPTPPRVPFTGANVSIGLIIMVALMVVAGVLLAAGRRRKVSTAE